VTVNLKKDHLQPEEGKSVVVLEDAACCNLSEDVIFQLAFLVFFFAVSP
jgi:hypothetical protein